MKHTIAFLTCLFAFCCCIIPANATDVTFDDESVLVSRTIQYLEDGTSIEISVYEDPITTYASDYMKSGSKIYEARNLDGNIMYTLTVRGVFSVDEGVAATCTSASYSTNIVDSDWSCTSASATKSGNRAIANGTFKLKLAGITIETDNPQVVLQCDDLGNLS